VKNLAILAQIDTQKLEMSDTLRIFEDFVGAKNYELSNHLGNVLATISDKTIFNTDHYNGIVYSAQLYYPFGWEIPTLSYTAKKYRFGFNGKEDDREWHAQDYGFRLYTPRESRFIGVDPITAQYPELTPYQFASNTPIQAVDLDGLEQYYAADGEYLGRVGKSSIVRVLNKTKDASSVDFKNYIKIANSQEIQAGFYGNNLQIISTEINSQLLSKTKVDAKLYSTIAEGQKSTIFNNLLLSTMAKNIKVSAIRTATNDATGDIEVQLSTNKFEIIKGLTWELTNSTNHKKLSALGDKAKKGQITRNDYIISKLAIEAEALITVDGVMSEVGGPANFSDYSSYVQDYKNGRKTLEQVTKEIATIAFKNNVTTKIDGKEVSIPNEYGKQYDSLRSSSKK
jgi:RHS repeat-associated protein